MRRPAQRRGSTRCSASAACSRRAAARRPPCSPARCASAPPARARRSPASSSRGDVELAVDEVPRFVSRGGIKLANALAASGLDVAGPPLPRRRRLDGRLHRLPAGGRRRARRRARRRLRRAQLAAARRSARDRDRAHQRARPAPDALPYAPELIVADVSFISLRTVLPAGARLRRAALRRARARQAAVRGRARARRPRRRRARRRAAPRARCSTSPRPRSPSAPRCAGFTRRGLPGPKGNIETFIALAEGARGSLAELDARRARGRPRMSARAITRA